MELYSKLDSQANLSTPIILSKSAVFLFNRICDCTNDDIIQHNYLTPILNSQYLSGINYLNAVAASSKNSNQSTPATQATPSTEKSALLEKLSTSLNQSLVSDGISSPWSDTLSFAVEYPSYLEKSVHIIKVNSFIYFSLVDLSSILKLKTVKLFTICFVAVQEHSLVMVTNTKQEIIRSNHKQAPFPKYLSHWKRRL